MPLRTLDGARPTAKDTMTALAFTEPDPACPLPPVWDAERLAELVADVGEAGVRDLLRLFQADMAMLMNQLAKATAAGDQALGRQLLAMAQDAAADLGLAALASLARDLCNSGADAAIPDLLATELARVRFVPPLKRAS